MMSNLAWEAIGRPAALEVFTLSEVPKNTELTLQYLPSYSNKVSIGEYGFSIGNTKYVQEPIYFTKDENYSSIGLINSTIICWIM